MSASATRCTVCGTDFGGKDVSKPRRGRGEVTLSLPLALVLLVVFSLLAAGATYAALRLTGLGNEVPPTPTATLLPTETPTRLPTSTATPLPTPTPLPPIEHTISAGETCIGLAIFYDVAIRSIQELNPGMQCELLSVGQTLFIPQPTPTPTPLPTSTLLPEEATRIACEKLNYTVKANDTLSGIASNYNVEMQAIMEYNGMLSATVFEGQILTIPLCRRLPTPGPTPTPTPPPPYPGPILLLPPDGAAFTLADDNVVLQWAAVAALRDSEYYKVTVLDVTEGSGTVRLVEYVKDTKFIVPTSTRPSEALPHIFRWWVTTVRQVGTETGGQPIFLSAGMESIKRDFTWSGTAPETTPTP